jgi:hypothetical protein
VTTFTVHLINTVSTAVEVEVDNYEAAIEAAYDSEDMPGSITIGAFGRASVDDGEWMPDAVTDEGGDEVWRERDLLDENERLRTEIERHVEAAGRVRDVVSAYVNDVEDGEKFAALLALLDHEGGA